MNAAETSETDPNRLVQSLSEPGNYPEPSEGRIDVHETHISWVFLHDRFAYKVKKPIRTDYLDYGSLEKRARACREELRLNRRYAPNLYLDVVPIVEREGGVRVGGEGEPVEYAVKMRRFPDDALLSRQVEHDEVGREVVHELAVAVANFHAEAPSAAGDRYASPESVLEWARSNFRAFAEQPVRGTESWLPEIEDWTEAFHCEHEAMFSRRVLNGFIRECHGDLHLENVIRWNGKTVPFDGIEFNAELRWIDVLNDTSLLAMDFAARGHTELSRWFTSDYLERTGDYASLPLFRFYYVYRALVRGKVLATRAGQADVTSAERRGLIEDARDHVRLALEATRPRRPTLWITHGLSGSGKTTGCDDVVGRDGAIRIRSDVERKRYFGLSPSRRPSGREIEKLYCESADQATYGRLRQIAGHVLRAGYSVIVDATFLRGERRRVFRDFAEAQGVELKILDFPCDEATLRRRIADRMEKGNDVSDAGIEVLEKQLRHHEPLTEDERGVTVTWSR